MQSEFSGGRWRAAIAALAIASPAAGVAADVPIPVAGWIETVVIDGLPVEAKLDTGAETSSIGATSMKFFSRQGAGWVRFGLAARPAQNPSRTIEAPVVRTVRVRRAGAPTERRPVIALPLCLVGSRITTEFTLTDRSGLDYVALVGRSALEGRVLVDPSRTHLAPAKCPAGP